MVHRCLGCKAAEVLRREGTTTKVLYRVLYSACGAEVLRCQRGYLIFKFFVVLSYFLLG
jgi:hypothetical protein